MWLGTILVTIVSSFFPVTGYTQVPEPGYYRTSGPDIVDPSGKPVILRGLGLGGWLMPEEYMLHIAAPDGGSPRSIRKQITDLIGTEDTETFFHLYTENYVKEKDIAAIAEWGFDHIRLPFHYDLLYNSQTDTFREDGFGLVDRFIKWCRRYDLKVILDMHAVPGAQNAYNISDSDGTARLWTEPVPYQDQTVTLWTEIARRYKDEQLIIGYDLINETVLPEGIPGADFKALFVRLVKAVREVDKNHILFIEGDRYATDFTALVPPFDNNMVYSFHKYWTETDQHTFQKFIDLRSTYHVPLWLGESGENSNTWFYETTRNMEKAGIGWNWWTHKKIETITSPLSAPFAPGYEELLKYWRGEGPRPSTEQAKQALFAMATNLEMDSCDTRPDVLAALMNPEYATFRKPYKNFVAPSIIYAADYDIGNQGTTYADTEYKTVSGTPGVGNSGAKYRNDGVDIEKSRELTGFPYYVTSTETGEWLSYTVDVNRAGTYDLDIVVAAGAAPGEILVSMDDNPVGRVRIETTGNEKTWQTHKLENISLQAGRHIFKVEVTKGGVNLYRFEFSARPR